MSLKKMEGKKSVSMNKVSTSEHRLLTIESLGSKLKRQVGMKNMAENIITSKEIQKITQRIDSLQKYLESDISQKEKQITAMILSKKYSELEELGFEYDVFNQELTINL